MRGSVLFRNFSRIMNTHVSLFTENERPPTLWTAESCGSSNAHSYQTRSLVHTRHMASDTRVPPGPSGCTRTGVLRGNTRGADIDAAKGFLRGRMPVQIHGAHTLFNRFSSSLVCGALTYFCLYAYKYEDNFWIIQNISHGRENNETFKNQFCTYENIAVEKIFEVTSKSMNDTVLCDIPREHHEAVIVCAFCNSRSLQRNFCSRKTFYSYITINVH